MARTDPQVNFRIPAELNDRLKEAAADNNRTITAELVSRLEASFRRTVDDDLILETVGTLERAVEHHKKEAIIAKAGASTSSKMVADLIEQTFGDTPPPELERVRNASRKVAELFAESLAAFEHLDLAKEAKKVDRQSVDKEGGNAKLKGRKR